VSTSRMQLAVLCDDKVTEVNLKKVYQIQSSPVTVKWMIVPFLMLCCMVTVIGFQILYGRT
jgi:hypothetical protein